jgi:NADPH:quinone reductase-like Zn-dependent oxidoreductase
MKAVIIRALGGPEMLEIVEQDIVRPGDGEVLLRVTSVGLNRADILFRQGRYHQTPRLPARTGMEVAGIVEEAGAGSPFRLGERVAALPAAMDISTQGGCAEYVTLPSRLLIPTPRSLDDRDAAAPWMQYFTAWGALNYVVKVQPGQFVVITAASSSVGIAAIQIANYLGAVPIATTTSPHKAARLRAAGAAHVVEMKSEKYVDRVREITGGQGADVVFDAVAGPGLSDHIRVAKPDAWILLYGALDLAPATVHPGLMVGKNIHLRGYNLKPLLADPAARAAAVEKITAALDSGQFRLVIDRRFPLSEIREAHRYLESNQQFGKIVVNP